MRASNAPISVPISASFATTPPTAVTPVSKALTSTVTVSTMSLIVSTIAPTFSTNVSMFSPASVAKVLILSVTATRSTSETNLRTASTPASKICTSACCASANSGEPWNSDSALVRLSSSACTGSNSGSTRA